MVAVTNVRVPRARLMVERQPGSNRFVDLGRVEDASFTVQGDPTITHDFDPIACEKYESSRDYLDVTGLLTAQVVDGDAKTIARHLLSMEQDVAAAVGKVFTSDAGVQDGDILVLGWAPAGTVTNGVFSPDPFTSAEDSGTPTSLIEGTHYEWYESRGGAVRLLDVSGLTPPLIFTGDSRATERAVFGDAVGNSNHLVLLGVNQQNQCTGERLEVWKAIVQTGTAVSMSSALSNMEPVLNDISFDVLSDTSRSGDTLLGHLGYWEQG